MILGLGWQTYFYQTCQTVDINTFRYHTTVQLVPNLFLLAIVRVNPENSFSLKCLDQKNLALEGMKHLIKRIKY